MLVLELSTVLVFAHFFLFSLAMPAPTSLLLPRTQYCANSPNTQAGTFLAGRDLAPSGLEHRGPDTMLYCAPNSKTYVVINLIYNVAQTGVMYLLKNAAQDVQTRIAQSGDGLVPNGIYMFDWKSGGYDCQFYCANSNNHQQTWGVVNAAIGAVWGYMLEKNNIGTATFTIYDGTNEVGRGTVDVIKV